MSVPSQAVPKQTRVGRYSKNVLEFRASHYPQRFVDTFFQRNVVKTPSNDSRAKHSIFIYTINRQNIVPTKRN